MLAYCHIANITPAPPRSQNTISPAIGALRINPPRWTRSPQAACLMCWESGPEARRFRTTYAGPLPHGSPPEWLIHTGSDSWQNWCDAAWTENYLGGNAVARACCWSIAATTNAPVRLWSTPAGVMTFACPISKFTCRFSGKLGVDVRPLFERAKNGRSLVAFGAR